MAPGRPQNHWPEEQRFVLYFLNERFEFDVHTNTNIFNHIFADQLSACGYPKGLGYKILGSQWHDRGRAGRSHLWDVALRKLQSDQKLQGQIIKQIQDAAIAVDAPNTSPVATKNITTRDMKHTETLDGTNKDNKSKTWKGWAVATSSEEDLLAQKEKENGVGVEAIAGTRTRHSKVHATDAPRNRNSNSASEDEDPVSEDGSESLGPKQTRQAEKEANPSRARLDMIHSKRIEWKDGVANLNAKDLLFISHVSPTYKFGGQVCRVTMSGGRDFDFMLCDPTFCTACHTSTADPTQESGTGGYPCVHASDTIREDAITFFEPKSGSNKAQIRDGYWRKVRFETPDGTISCPVKVCDYSSCAVCSGSEQLRNPWRWDQHDEQGSDAEETIAVEHEDEVTDKGSHGFKKSVAFVETTAQDGSGRGLRTKS
ncbi:hypothetical protein LTR37_013903 [Vermiconidia calcicola]|uniref:Uncharacterized protein n=1 Tax=Vermiconidia calcicola TaxID=1690605 RepID=A0ACC3MV47_9PEZI|nr:hypothetical protein LTR37_013903 [Vermiconidia calcicola]